MDAALLDLRARLAADCHRYGVAPDDIVGASIAELRDLKDRALHDLMRPGRGAA